MIDLKPCAIAGGQGPDLLELLVGEDRRGQLELVGAARHPAPGGCPPGPIAISVAVMISSRIASIGGLVTWAKSCLK